MFYLRNTHHTPLFSSPHAPLHLLVVAIPLPYLMTQQMNAMTGNPGGVGVLNPNASSLPPIGGGGMLQPQQGGQAGTGAGSIGGVTGQTVRQKVNPNQASLRQQQQLQQQQMSQQQQQQQQMQPQPGSNASLGGSGFQGAATRRRRKSKTGAQLLSHANQGMRCDTYTSLL